MEKKGVTGTMEEGMNVHGEESLLFYCTSRWERTYARENAVRGVFYRVAVISRVFLYC